MAELGAASAFHFEDEPVAVTSGRVLRSIGYIAFLAILAGIFAGVRLRRVDLLT